jgi:phosphorylase/glycogen(starch) synthase
VIERWWEEILVPRHRAAVVHAHGWQAGAALLATKARVPAAATVFTLHSTALGRALSTAGRSPLEGLEERPPAELAEAHGVRAEHSMEAACVRAADVLTSVSEVTADEAQALHGRRPDVLLPNGIDLGVIAELAGPEDPKAVRRRLVAEASRFLGEDVSDAVLLGTSGRYELHNRGLDVLLEALARLEGPGRPRVVLFAFFPAGNSGVKAEMIERRSGGGGGGPVGLSTHNLFDEEKDPAAEACRRLGIGNAPGSRVKVVHVPATLGPGDGFLDLPYEAVLGALDLTCFPSYYEPWGHAPQESLAVGVPTVVSDYGGFGRWALAQGLGEASGVTVLRRVSKKRAEIVVDLEGRLEAFLAAKPGSPPRVPAATARATAALTAWSEFFAHHEAAHREALARAAQRAERAPAAPPRAKRSLEVKPTLASTPRLTPFDVTAGLPAPLGGLERVARNFWWCWDAHAPSLFEDLDPALWAACRRNPVALLQQVDPAVLQRRSADRAYLRRLAATLARFEAAMSEDRADLLVGTDASGKGPLFTSARPVAYFSAEFGIHESLPIYGGGLGVLAGDHLKSASDLGVPLVGVGLFYRMGYLRQRLTAAGEQTVVDVENDPHALALERVRVAGGAPLEVKVPLPGRTLALRAWRARVGRVSLYLLDSDAPSNQPEDRDITRNLYGGDAGTRILQEIVLGRGGARLLAGLGLHPAVYHMNEGHAAFLALERVSRLVGEEGLPFDAARELVRATTTFTTHTPVPAGHDRFSEDLVRRYFSDADQWVGLPWDRFYDLGRTREGEFNMTWLALSFASYVNGVSRLHERASRRLLADYWPGLLEDELPVRSITNGVHLPTWTSPRIGEVLGLDGSRPVVGEDFRAPADGKALWRAHVLLKKDLLVRARASLEAAFHARSDSPALLHEILQGLTEDALLVGFARRFAPYKRAHLLFQDLERLKALVSDAARPVRILVAGKAHPRDERGREILRDIAARSRGPDLAGRVVFLEDYDIGLARALVQGVDVWLNTPTRNEEASGTSGMKAAANGALNLSIADGWWAEAGDGEIGWTIGHGAALYADPSLQDQFDGAALHRLLEEEVVPLYFRRGRDGFPKDWVARMARSLSTLPPVFDATRMVREYFDQAYQPLGRSAAARAAAVAAAKDLAREGQRIRRGFPGVKVLEAHIADQGELKVGDALDVTLDVALGDLAPADVRVELVVGRARGKSVADPVLVPLAVAPHPSSANGAVRYEGRYVIAAPGHYAHGLRIRARHPEPSGGTLKDLVLWA